MHWEIHSRSVFSLYAHIAHAVVVDVADVVVFFCCCYCCLEVLIWLERRRKKIKTRFNHNRKNSTQRNGLSHMYFLLVAEWIRFLVFFFFFDVCLLLQSLLLLFFIFVHSFQLCLYFFFLQNAHICAQQTFENYNFYMYIDS